MSQRMMNILDFYLLNLSTLTPGPQLSIAWSLDSNYLPLISFTGSIFWLNQTAHQFPEHVIFILLLSWRSYLSSSTVT